MPQSVPASARLRWSTLRRSTQVLVVLFVLLLLTGSLELLARAYWSFGRGVPVWDMGRIWNAYYPELAVSGVERAPTSANHDAFEVLLLGGSTMFLARGALNAQLVPALERQTGRPVHLTNLAWVGRTSLDSRLKYEHVADKRFDLVLVYDGFNDVRMNNCKPGTAFRRDYSHDPRYAELNALARHREIGWFALPFTAEFVASAVCQRLGLAVGPDKQWSANARVETPASFEANLDAIARTAARRGDRLVLMTFAYHLPADYTDEAYLQRRLDYGDVFAPLYLWGERQTVARAVEGHNDAIRRVAARHYVRLIVQAVQLVDAVYVEDADVGVPSGNPP